ncbi:RidA family protein [Hyphococcus sp.]|uniref:RidA family protein n=1 Tax=Hyphococcus sp. TaxID=2038636 RepID=UPI003D0C5285
MKKYLGAALALALAASCGEAENKTREVYRDPALSADLPFSSAVVVGDVIYLSGEIGRAPGTTSVVEGGAGPQTRQIFENYEATLGKLDAGLEDIVKCTVFLEDMQDYATMNEAYAAAFPGDKPARSTMGVDGLALGAAVEIECLAVKS